MIERLIKKYKSISTAAKASYWYIICNLFQKGLAFLAIPIYTRLLSTTEYGAYSVYTTWLSIITIFASLSLSSGFFNVGMLKYEHERNRFLSTVQGLSTISTLIVIAFCAVFHDCFYSITDLNESCLVIMSFQMIFSTPVLYWSAKQRFEYKYVKVVAVTMASSLLTVALSICMIYLLPNKGYSLILGTAVVQVAVGIFFYLYNLIKGKFFYDKDIWKYAASFGITLIPHYLAYSILNSSDRIMINNLCNTSDVGIYSLACSLATAVNLVTSAIDCALNPWVFQKLKSGDYKKISNITNYIIAAFGIVVVGCTMVAPELLLIAASEEFQDAKWVMPPVIAGCYFLYLGGCFMRVAFYHEKKKVITITSAVAAVMNIALNFIFIPVFGYIAAAYTTLLSYILFSVVHFFAMKSICKKNGYSEIPFNTKIIFFISVSTTLLSLIMILLYKFPLVRYGLLLAIMIAVIANKRKIIEVYNDIKK